MASTWLEHKIYIIIFVGSKIKYLHMIWAFSEFSSIIWPWATSHLHSDGPRPSHASFTARSSCPHLRGSSSFVGTNVTIPGQNYKYSSRHPFHYSQANWWSSFTFQRSLMTLSDWVLNGSTDRVLSHWFPTRKSSHAGACRKTGQWRRCERGGAQSNEDVI